MRITDAGFTVPPLYAVYRNSHFVKAYEHSATADLQARGWPGEGIVVKYEPDAATPISDFRDCVEGLR